MIRQIILLERDVEIRRTRGGARAGSTYISGSRCAQLLEVIEAAYDPELVQLDIGTPPLRSGARIVFCAYKRAGEPTVAIRLVDVKGRQMGRASIMDGAELVALKRAARELVATCNGDDR
jgi:hypothetical protein